MPGRLQDVILRGLRADQPLPADVSPGALYYVTDESVTERVSDDGTTWEDYSDSGSGISAINISAGTTSNNLTNLVFSNSNGVSFGLNGSTITATLAALTSQSNQAASAANGSFAFQTLGFSNANGVSFITSAGSFIAASISTSLTAINISGGTTSNNLSALVFSNSNNVSFGLNGSTLTASVTVASTQGSINVSGGTTSNNLSNIVFSNSNGVSFGLNGSTLTASISVTAGGGSLNVSAGTTSNNLTNIVFSNSNGVSFGLNGSTITASASGGSGGGGTTLNYLVNLYHTQSALNNLGQASLGMMSIQPFLVPQQMASGYAEWIQGQGFSQSTIGATSNTTYSASRGITFGIQLFTRPSGANSSLLSGLSTFTQTMGVGVTVGGTGSQHTVSVGVSYPFQNTTSTFSTSYGVSSASYVFSTSVYSRFSSYRAINFPIPTLSPDNYWIATFYSSTSSQTGAPGGFAMDNNWNMSQVYAVGAASDVSLMGTNINVNSNFGGGSLTLGASVLSTAVITMTRISNFNFGAVVPVKLIGV